MSKSFIAGSHSLYISVRFGQDPVSTKNDTDCSKKKERNANLPKTKQGAIGLRCELFHVHAVKAGEQAQGSHKASNPGYKDPNFGKLVAQITVLVQAFCDLSSTV